MDHQFKLCLGLFLTVFILAEHRQTALGQEKDADESRFIKNVRQVTLEGRRAGEGYFSADGTKMVFQSERREDNPFFQIYLLDFEFGEVEPVSPGHGKTTCAWIHPNGQQVLYSSTQDDPEAKAKQKQELEFRESGQSRRYSWDYDEHYELYSYDVGNKTYRRLTDARGYDAEGSYSPDGKLIAFASNRNAYTQELTAAEREAFERDPAVMMDIFIMNADGTNIKQLTQVPGYDGGPFFSPDGKRICWRRFAENGATAEIMTMNIDGSDQRQLTRIGAMSWAPFYHPSGEYLIFTTNRHGFANFELYLVDTEGKSLPVRVSTSDGFDGLASFSPDGKKLTWTSNRNDKKESQIYLADWNHEAARRALSLTSDAEEKAARQGNKTAQMTNTDCDPRDVMRHVDYLCRKELGGRMTGSDGEKKATRYVAAYLDYLGLKPAGDEGTWFQSFKFPAGAELGTGNQLSLVSGEQTQSGDCRSDWMPLGFSANGTVKNKGIVFAGYGIVAPAGDGIEEYDSYVHLDVKDKWVMILRYMPENLTPEQRQHFQFHSSLRKKAMDARDKGACGVIVVSGPNSQVRNQLVPLQGDFSRSASSIGAISVTDQFARQILASSGKQLRDLQNRLDTGQPMMGFPVKNAKLTASIDVVQKTGRGRNVVGRLQMSDSPSADAILVGAHIDHLGRGSGGSLARNEERDAIHFGADDNASGVAAMLEVAEYLVHLKRANRLPLKRDIVFAAWSGEELGLHGSQHFVAQLQKENSKLADALPADGSNPHDVTLAQIREKAKDALANQPSMNLRATRAAIVELQLLGQLIEKGLQAYEGENGKGNPQVREMSDTLAVTQQAVTELKTAAEEKAKTDVEDSIYPRIAACLNMDMVGRMEKQLVLQGIGSSQYWAGEIEKRNAVVGLPIKLNSDTDLPTDASSFYRAGVPILAAFTGSHSDYHTPRDTPEKLNYESAAKIAKLMALITRSLAISDTTPEYQKQTAKKQQSRGRMRAYLGTVPDYASDIPGVLLSDATAGGPAADAGIKSGDVIVELAGRKIENIYDYTYAIEALKIGQQTTIVVLRNEKRIKLKITPGSRD